MFPRFIQTRQNPSQPYPTIDELRKLAAAELPKRQEVIRSYRNIPPGATPPMYVLTPNVFQETWYKIPFGDMFICISPAWPKHLRPKSLMEWNYHLETDEGKMITDLFDPNGPFTFFRKSPLFTWEYIQIQTLAAGESLRIIYRKEGQQKDVMQEVIMPADPRQKQEYKVTYADNYAVEGTGMDYE